MNGLILIDCLNPISYTLNDCHNIEDTINKFSALNLGHKTLDNAPPRATSAYYNHLYENYGHYDFLLYFYRDEPFIDTALSIKMLQNHIKYQADYSLAEGYPEGFAPQIISCKILPSLAKLVGKEPSRSRKHFFEVIKADINEFDIETEIGSIDLRMLRIELNTEHYRNTLICQQLKAAGLTNAVDAPSIIENNRQLVYSIPSYYNIQIYNQYPTQPNYLPPNASTPQLMTLAQFKTILEDASTLSKEATIGISYLGDALNHPLINDFIRLVMGYPLFKLHIETVGINVAPSTIELLKSTDPLRLSLIIMLDSIKAECYQKIHGSGFEEALAFSHQMLTELPTSSYVQTVRTSELEAELEPFYRYFSKITDHIIINKYDDFCGLLPRQKMANIAPINRNVCWAIKRELSINVDGRVHGCRCDTKGYFYAGNAFTDHLETIWQKINELRLAHINELYPDYCHECDEYYIFNF